MKIDSLNKILNEFNFKKANKDAEYLKLISSPFNRHEAETFLRNYPERGEDIIELSESKSELKNKVKDILLGIDIKKLEEEKEKERELLLEEKEKELSYMLRDILTENKARIELRFLNTYTTSFYLLDSYGKTIDYFEEDDITDLNSEGIMVREEGELQWVLCLQSPLYYRPIAVQYWKSYSLELTLRGMFTTPENYLDIKTFVYSAFGKEVEESRGRV